METVDLLAKPTVELGLGLLIDNGQHFLALSAAAREFLFDETSSVAELVAMVEFDTNYGQPLSPEMEQ